MTSRTLIVCGDDLGLHAAINEGIFRCHEEGVLRVASLVVAGDAAEEALQYAHAHDGLDVGVHLTLLDAKPVGNPEPWRGLLDRQGCFPPSAHASSLARLAARVTARPGAALAEFAAQIDRAEDLGLRPTHADGHNHLHLLPSLARGVVELCVDRGIPWLRVPRGPVRRLISWRWSADRGGIKGTMVRAAGAAAVGRLRGTPLRTADHLIGLGLFGERVTAPLLAGLVDHLQVGITEWMAHPAAPSRDLASAFPWGSGWGGEMAALCDPTVRDALDRAGVQVTGFSGIRTFPA